MTRRMASSVLRRCVSGERDRVPSSASAPRSPARSGRASSSSSPDVPSACSMTSRSGRYGSKRRTSAPALEPFRAGDVKAKLLDQPALPDPGFAHGDEGASLADEGALREPRRTFELTLAPHHRCRRDGRPRAPRLADDREGRHGFGFAPDVEPPLVAPREPACGCAARGLATSTVPGSACDCRRAAVLIASPVAPYSTRPPPPTGPSTTSPVSIPTRTAIGRSASPTMRSPARIARSASSSSMFGAPTAPGARRRRGP